MKRNVFISFRHEDGIDYKNELSELFSKQDFVIDCSENIDRKYQSDRTIQDHLYQKIKRSSVTIVLLTPKAINHQRTNGKYDDWMYDEIRFSLEDRENNRSNGLIAVYTPEAEQYIQSINSCHRCEKHCSVTTINYFNNLARHNMMNVHDDAKKHSCEGVYDSNWDSYCTLVSFEEFKNNYKELINCAEEKRDSIEAYTIKKSLNN